MNEQRFTNVWRWHLAIQNLRTTGRLGRAVQFNKSGWEKYRIQVQAALKAIEFG